MALLLAEPFSHYLSTTTTEAGSLNDDGTTVWSSNSMLFNNTAGRFGARVMEVPTINRVLAMRLGTVTGTTLIVGGSVKYNVAESTAPVVRTLLRGLRSNGAVNWTIQIGPAGTFYVLDAAGALVSTIQRPLANNVWHRLEVKVVHADAGTMTIRLDGVQIASISADFLNSTLSIERIELGGNDNAFYWEDVIVMDGSGSTFNDFIGDVRFELAAVDADGATAAWTPLSGANYTNIDDAVGAYDSDTTYISSAVTDQDNYASHAAISATNASQILFAQLLALARSDTTTDKIAMLVNSGGTVNVGADIALVNGAYRWRKKIWETDPNTAAAWTVTNINAAEWGVRKRV